ncbi:hypothetical protein L211DRAFT_772084, partial [Terfezia boudieri ATCC MYA-4762]
IGPHLSGKQREELFGLVIDFLDVFSKGTRLGKVKGFKAAIRTEGPLPTPQQARPTGPTKRKIIDETIDQLLAWDVVEKSTSTTASPIVMVWQNNKWRF